MLKRLFIIALALNAMSFAADGKEGDSRPAQAAGAGAGTKKLAKKNSSSSSDSDSDATTKPKTKKNKTKPNAAIHLDQLLAPAVTEAVRPLKRTIKESAQALTKTVDTSAATLSAACAKAIEANAATATQAISQACAEAIKANAAKVAEAASGRALAWNAGCVAITAGGVVLITRGEHEYGIKLAAAGMGGIALSKPVLDNCTLM